MPTDKQYVVCITEQKKYGLFDVNSLVYKSITARTKAITVDSSDSIKAIIGISLSDLLLVFPSFQNYIGRCKHLKKGDQFNFELLKELTKK